MDKMDKTTEVLFKEFLKFQHNPNKYFGQMTNIALNMVATEYDKLDTEKVLRQLEFFHVFVENLEKLDDKNITKLFKYASKDNPLVLQWLYSRMAILTDLIEADIINGKSFDSETQTIQTVLYGVIKHVNIVYWFVKGFVERYKPNQSEAQYGAMMDLIGLDTMENNPNEYSNEAKVEIRRSLNACDESLYS